MGRITKGILGGFSGTVATVVGGNWKGIDYMRGKSNKGKGAPTTAQLQQQEKFALIVRFLQSMTAVLEVTFKNYAVRMTAINAAASYNLQNAIAGTESPFNIAYPFVLVSRGDLPNASNPAAVPIAGNKVKFTWLNNGGLGKAKDTDKAILVVYSVDFNQALYTLGSAPRSAEQETLDATMFVGQTVETWVAFISADGKTVSSSFYTGSMNLLP